MSKAPTTCPGAVVAEGTINQFYLAADLVNDTTPKLTSRVVVDQATLHGQGTADVLNGPTVISAWPGIVIAEGTVQDGQRPRVVNATAADPSPVDDAQLIQGDHATGINIKNSDCLFE